MNESIPLTVEQKTARRAELLAKYRTAATGAARDQLYWANPELQEIFSAAMHAQPAAPAKV